MKLKNMLFAALGWMVAGSPAWAFEFGSPGFAQQGGLTFGASAATPPPGLYMFNQAMTYQANLAGPGTRLTGTNTGVQAAAGATGLVWIPGWTFLGGTYGAVLVQGGIMDSVGSPFNVQQSGLHNTFIIPAELSWRLGDSGFFVKTGLGMYVPTGTQTGVNGLGNVGAPWWTFQPEIFVSYIKDGWNITSNIFAEFNTRNTITQYQSGDILHAEFAATKRIGQWSVGPVAYYIGQVTNDKSSAFYGNAINVNRYNIWAVGALVGYDFGPAALNVWATNEIVANASGGMPVAGIDTATVAKGFKVFATLSYRIWAPDEPSQTPKLSTYHK
ncbi:transporter [Bradyrhizobium sp. KBS0727]|uniref:SphA family protein n=1 Tax=unclassified Bradyrhizobium TaxID=2631580 RepID=UPI00110F5045|nr:MULTISPECIES: transporter [unclassified Bradyrhizobium]QDW40558.1 transporter [Bradyrhizobium sp. KBS0725]QDW47163.1 transporter [Bradyrhizobium sp. KBS0727]